MAMAGGWLAARCLVCIAVLAHATGAVAASTGPKAKAGSQLPPKAPTAAKRSATQLPQTLSRCGRWFLGGLTGALLLGGKPAVASPFEPRRAPPSWVRGTFFDGWFMRLVDHDSRFSFCVILGSMREHGQECTDASGGYSSHYIGISYLDADGKTHTHNYFPDPRSVSITSGGGRPLSAHPPRSAPADFRWAAAGFGELLVKGDNGSLVFTTPEGITVQARFKGRIPWSRADPDGAGPEGWLASTGLLPLHYFVHSFGSAAEYEVQVKGNKASCASGSGRLHMECNYGDMFPSGWIWAQGCSSSSSNANTRSKMENHKHKQEEQLLQRPLSEAGSTHEPLYFVLTGGMFKIGPLAPLSWVIGLRWGGEEWNFRSTDLDSVKVLDLCHRRKSVSIRAVSRCKTRLLELDMQAPADSFGQPICVPTKQGWSSAPGCVESYAATAHIRCFRKNSSRKWEPVVQQTVPLAALEFGGDYQST